MAILIVVARPFQPTEQRDSEERLGAGGGGGGVVRETHVCQGYLHRDGTSFPNNRPASR